MAGYNLGSAYIQIVPSMDGLSPAITKGISNAEKKASGDFGGKLWKGLKLSAVGAGVAIGGVLSSSVVKGFQRLSAIEQAEAKLKGLGNSAKTVSGVMDNALSAVKGTAYGLDEAATLAGTLVASGVKPGKELEKTLRLTADSATIAGRGLDDMGLIWSSVASKGKLQGDDAMQLMASGVPIWQMVGKAMGVTAAEAQALGSKGKVSFETFRKAMEQGVGGAALESGNTTVGAFKNMNAALGRFGASLIKGVFPLIGPAFGRITVGIDAATAAVGPMVETFTAGVTSVYNVLAKGKFDGNLFGLKADSPVVGMLFRVRDAAIAAGGAISKWITGGGIQRVAPIFTAVAVGVGAAVVKLAAGVGAAVVKLAGVGKVLSPLKGAFLGVGKSMTPLLSGLRFMLGPVGLLISGIAYLTATNEEFRGAMLQLGKVLGTALGDTLTALMPVIGTVATTIAGLGPVLATALTAAAPALTSIVNGVSGLIQWLSPALPVIAGVAGAFLGVTKVVGFLVPIIGKVISVARLLMPVFSAIVGVVGWVPIVITAVVAGLVLFFTKTETGRKIVSAAWAAIQTAIGAVVTWFQTTVLPILASVWNGIATGAQWLYTNVILPVWNGIKTAIGVVVTWVQTTLVPIFQAVWTGISTGALWLYNSVILPVWTGIKIAIALVVAAVMTYVQLWVGFFQTVVAPVFQWLWTSVIQPVWNGIKAAIAAVVTWFQTTAWPLLKVVIGYIGAGFRVMKGVISAVWSGVKTAVGVVAGWFMTYVWPVISRAISAIKAGFSVMRGVISAVWSGVKTAVGVVAGWFMSYVWPVISRAISAIKAGFRVMKGVISAVWSGVKTAVGVVADWFMSYVWPVISRAISAIKGGFNLMKSVVGAAWRGVKSLASPVVNWFSNTVKPLFDRVTTGIKNAFTKMKDSVGKAWDGVKEKAKAPIKFVVDTVINNGIVGNFNKIAGKFGVGKLPAVKFATGGVMPGYTPGRDVHDFYSPTGGRLRLSGGEAIMRPEWTRAVGGPREVARQNAAARKGQAFKTGGVYSSGRTQAFKDGGVWGWLKGVGGDALDYIKGGAKFVTDALADPGGVFKKIVSGLASKIPVAGLMGDVAKAVPVKIVDALGKSLTAALSSGESSAAAVPGGGGHGGSLSAVAALAAQMGLTKTSGFRRGARTAKSGSVSLHALGRAYDFAASASKMMAFFNAVDARYAPTELLYSPAGARNRHRGGGRYRNSGATLSNHYNHVHVGFRRGGWTGPGAQYAPAGIVHADEHVIRKSSRRSIEKARPGYLDALNAYGARALAGLPGYAKGGKVKRKRPSPYRKIGATTTETLKVNFTGSVANVKTGTSQLAKGILAEFNKKAQGRRTSWINTLSDDISKLNSQAAKLKKQAKETRKVGKKTVLTASAVRAADKLRDVNKKLATKRSSLKAARRGNLTSLVQGQADAFYAKYAAKNTAKLGTLAKTRVDLAAKIKSANTKLTDAIKLRDDYSSSVTDKLSDTYALSETSATTGVETIIARFKEAVGNVGAFKSNISKLMKAGLPAGLVDQIVQLGAVTGNKVAKNLLSGSSLQLKDLGKQYTALNSVSTSTGKALGTEMYGAGVNAAKGYVKGLQADLKSVEKASAKLADKTISTVTKRLKIKSPSRVMKAIGGFAGEGYAGGVEALIPRAQGAMESLVRPPQVSRMTADARIDPSAYAQSGQARAGDTFNLYGPDPAETARQIEIKRQQKAALRRPVGRI